MGAKEDLISYYSQSSKHSNYQVLPDSLKSVVADDEVQTRTRYEAERLAYLKNHIDFNDKTVIDIGGNTGYFTFELLDAGARSVHHYEGNKEHSEFVRLAAEVLGVSEKVKTTNDYYLFDGSDTERYDICLLFNVLHHLGDDYGGAASAEAAREGIIKQLNSMNRTAQTMVYQMGFNWQGDPSKPLFENGTKQEVIDYVTDGIEGHWRIESIGVAEKTADGISYAAPNESNIKRDDSLGEFLNRPIFILSSTSM